MKLVIGPWRLIWYSVLIWMLTFFVSGVVIMPWFYLVMPLIILLATVYYFDKSETVKYLSLRKIKKHKDSILAIGLVASIFWFLVTAALDFFQLANFYYFNLTYYFSDPRNWLIYPLILLMPVVYAILLEQSMFRKSRRKMFRAGRARVNS